MPASKYSEEITDKICEQIATSNKSMATILKEFEVDYSTHLRWLDAHEEYRGKYARAKEQQADFLAEEILQIADASEGDVEYDDEGNAKLNSEFVQRSRLRIDARKWVAAKLKPKKYGEKLDVTSDGEKVKTFSVEIVKNECKD